MNNFEERLALIEAVLAGDMSVEEARRRRIEVMRRTHGGTTGIDKERIRDHLSRDGWSEFTVREVFAAIGDEFEMDPENGHFLLELHLAAARKASH